MQVHTHNLLLGGFRNEGIRYYLSEFHVSSIHSIMMREHLCPASKRHYYKTLQMLSTLRESPIPYNTLWPLACELLKHNSFHDKTSNNLNTCINTISTSANRYKLFYSNCLTLFCAKLPPARA